MRFLDKEAMISNVDWIRTLIGQPNCHFVTVKGIIHHVECQVNAHFGRTESLKINPKPPLHSMATVCKLFECANRGSKPYRLEMSKKVVIDYGLDKWRKWLDDDTISLDEIRNTYKLFHTKDLGTKHLDYNIRLAFKTKFKDQLANFAGMDTFCYNCKTMANR